MPHFAACGEPGAAEIGGRSFRQSARMCGRARHECSEEERFIHMRQAFGVLPACSGRPRLLSGGATNDPVCIGSTEGGETPSRGQRGGKS